MDASAGISKNNKVPAPPPMPRPGLTASRATSRLGLGPPRRIPDPWTRPPDDIARGDATVAARNRLLSTPPSLPTLSANGARAGLGPDRTGPDSSAGSDVPARPDPALSKPIASRVGADIGTATELAQARALGLDTPPEAPSMSRAGARAGLGPLVTGSPGDAARASTMARDLAQSISQIRSNARSLLTQASTSVAPIQPLSDASARAGLSGSTPIAAANRGFTMRVPKSPVAQDRDRWASGTQARIAGAAKGLGLAKAEWGDHSTPKPIPKRTWVGVHGDATENPYDTGACSDLTQPPHGAVNKSAAPLRELEKERVPSDECPPLGSSAMLEVILRGDTRLAARETDELVRTWAMRPSLLRGGPGGVTSVSFKPPAAATKGLGTGSSCGCNDCGCNGGPSKKNGARMMSIAPVMHRRGRMKPTQYAPSASGTAPSGEELAALVESFAARHGKDPTAEWFVAVFARGDTLALGTEQRASGLNTWHPNPNMGMRPGDRLVATIHTHSRSAEFSVDDRAAGAALGVPMVLIVPGAERARVYDPSSGSVTERLFGKDARKRWKFSAGSPGASSRTANALRGGRSTRGRMRSGRAAGITLGPIAISQPLPGQTPYGVWRPVTAAAGRGSLANARRQGEIIDGIIDRRVLQRAIQLAIDNIGNPKVSPELPELIWLQVSAEAATWRLPVAAAGIPDPDLFRAIVAVAQRKGRDYRDGYENLILDLAKQEPLWVEPALLDLIVEQAREHGAALGDAWFWAWKKRVEMGTPLPTPPDLELFRAIAFAAARSTDPAEVLNAAHYILGPPDPNSPAVWPRHITPTLLELLVLKARYGPQATPNPPISPWPSDVPSPTPSDALMQEIISVARETTLADPRDILNEALARELSHDFVSGRVGYDVETRLLEQIVHFAEEAITATVPDIWSDALDARRAMTDVPWPPDPVPDRDLLDAIVLSANLIPKVGDWVTPLSSWFRQQFNGDKLALVLSLARYMLGRSKAGDEANVLEAYIWSWRNFLWLHSGGIVIGYAWADPDQIGVGGGHPNPVYLWGNVIMWLPKLTPSQIGKVRQASGGGGCPSGWGWLCGDQNGSSSVAPPPGGYCDGPTCQDEPVASPQPPPPNPPSQTPPGQQTSPAAMTTPSPPYEPPVQYGPQIPQAYGPEGEELTEYIAPEVVETGTAIAEEATATAAVTQAPAAAPALTPAVEAGAAAAAPWLVPVVITVAMVATMVLVTYEIFKLVDARPPKPGPDPGRPRRWPVGPGMPTGPASEPGTVDTPVVPPVGMGRVDKPATGTGTSVGSGKGTGSGDPSNPCKFIRRVYYGGPCAACWYDCPGYGAPNTYQQDPELDCPPVGANGLVDTSKVGPKCRPPSGL